MDYYIVELKIPEQLSVAQNDRNAYDTFVADLVQRIKTQQAEFLGWHRDHGEEFDNHDDDFGIIVETATFVEVRLGVDTDMLNPDDSGESLYAYMLDALELRPGYISNVYDREQEALSKTVIEIIIKEILPPVVGPI